MLSSPYDLPLMWSSNRYEAVVTALQEIHPTLGVDEHHRELYSSTDKTLPQAFCLAALGGMECDISSRGYKRLDRSGKLNLKLFKALTQGGNHPISPL
jgi:hypothetical protein